MKENIAIIGFMGSGKTTVGKILAERLGYIFFDLDRLIELSEGRSISDIFKENGEEYFRDIEAKILKKIKNNKKCVFACGGGIILRGENMRSIIRKCNVVYLMISPSEAFERLKGATGRPLLTEKERSKKISDLLLERTGLYSKYAEITIDNEGLSPEEAVEAIIKKIDKEGLSH